MSVSGVACRVSGMALLGTASGTVLTLVLALFGTDTGPVHALAWPNSMLRICTRRHRGSARLLVHPGTPVPWVHPLAPPGTPCCISTSVHVRGTSWHTPWGSLWAAPVARLAGHVTWPVTWPYIAPLIGTHCPAPRVTQQRCLTASIVINTLLWSTFRGAG